MERYRGLLERYVDQYNAGDLDGVMDLYGEDSIQLMPTAPSRTNGLRGVDHADDAASSF